MTWLLRDLDGNIQSVDELTYLRVTGMSVAMCLMLSLHQLHDGNLVAANAFHKAAVIGLERQYPQITLRPQQS